MKQYQYRIHVHRHNGVAKVSVNKFCHVLGGMEIMNCLITWSFRGKKLYYITV